MEQSDESCSIPAGDIDVDVVCQSVDRIIADEASDFSFTSRPHHLRADEKHFHHKKRRRRSTEFKDQEISGGLEQTICRVWMLTLALMIPFSLILTSGGKDVFAMAPMQTRVLDFVPSMTKALVINRMAYSPLDAGNFSVYQFDEPCPPLKGPVETKTATENMTVSPGDFTYRSLYLNRGSLLSVDVNVLEGKAAVYLVAGELGFDEFRNYPQDYKYSAVATAIQEKTSNVSATQRHLRFEYEIPSSDIYYLIYWNPKKKDFASIKASIVAQMTTHLLDDGSGGAGPMCHGASECFFRTSFWQPGCVIIRADGGASFFENDLNRFPILSVEVVKRRRWAVIFGVSAIPLLIVLWYSDKASVGPFQPRRTRRGRHGSDDGRLNTCSAGQHCETNPLETSPLCGFPAGDEETASTMADSVSYQTMATDADGDNTCTKHVKWAHPVRTIMADPPSHRLSPTPRSA